MAVSEQDLKLAKKAASRILRNEVYQLHPVERGIYDVFAGEGFKLHARYRNYHGRWFRISGAVFNHDKFPAL